MPSPGACAQTPDGRPTGEAFVELKDEEAQREAMKRHKEKMGARYIEIFTSTKSALVQVGGRTDGGGGAATLTRRRWRDESSAAPLGTYGARPLEAGWQEGPQSGTDPRPVEASQPARPRCRSARRQRR